MKLEQKRTKNGQIFPSPREGETMFETPPALCWLREDVKGPYQVTVRRGGETVWRGETEKNYVVPEKALPAGDYEWNVEADGRERGWQAFSIAENAVEFIRPDADALFDAVPDVRPRMLFFRGDAPEIVRTREAAVGTLRRNVALALSDGMPEPPRFHVDPQALPYREYFGRHRDFCDRDLVACALAHALLGDEAAAAHAKKLFLTLCDWNSEGPCSLEGPWGDEVGLSHARCFPAVFDMLYDLLDGKERLFAARVTAAYAFQCERRLRNLDFCQNPGNSHAGRLPAYLGEAAMSLKGVGVVPEDVLRRWLTYAVDIYGGVFPYFGGPDGGWAEGMFYASSYTKWYLPFFSAVERFSGASFLKRPFYQRLIRYFQHFCPPGWENHPFGDGYWCRSDDPEWPGFFAQNPWHIYAERFGTELERGWSKAAQAQEIFKLHLLDVFLPEGAPDENSLAGDAARARAFPDAGYASLHTDPRRPERELALLARASRYGSISHEHADQGSFALMAGGTALISPSGYFGRRCSSAHHLGWTRRAKAHNTILVNGEGQLYEACSSGGEGDKRYLATGRVLYARDEGGALRAAVDPSAAYEHVTAWTRSFELTEGGLVVTDHIELDAPGEVAWLLHSLSRPEIRGGGMALRRNGWRLVISPEEGGLANPQISDAFDVDLNAGEPEAYHVTMPPQYHMRWTTEKRRVHDIRVRFDVTRDEE
ncbi:MAG: heparinase II/III family protein [Clostridia bacterium]|nr:heparinase II/III family protein [Clostridia bacterium]